MSEDAAPNAADLAVEEQVEALVKAREQMIKGRFLLLWLNKTLLPKWEKAIVYSVVEFTDAPNDKNAAQWMYGCIRIYCSFEDTTKSLQRGASSLSAVNLCLCQYFFQWHSSEFKP